MKVVRSEFVVSLRIVYGGSGGRMLARSLTKLKAFGLPNPVDRSHPVVAGYPAMPLPKGELSLIVTMLKVRGTMSLKSPEGSVYRSGFR